MGLSLLPLGGFGEVGKNCLAVSVDNDLVILDMGVHLEHYIELTGNDFFKKKHVYRQLVASKSIPDIRPLNKLQSSLRAICCSHGHLDHIGAVPFLSKKLRAPIYATKYTTKLISSFCADHNVHPHLVVAFPNKLIRLSPKLSVEFIHVAHSIPHSSIIALHTPYGIVLYANDYKNDQTPPYDVPTNMSRIKELQDKVTVLLLDCLYAHKKGFVPSELSAKQQLFSLKNDLSSYRAIIISTFSSHISRLQAICDLADSMGREIIFLGRSLSRYANAASQADIVDLSLRGKFFSYARQVKRFLSSCSSPQKYIIVVTGHQGEPGAVLDRMSKGEFSFTKNDVVIFSCSIIPTPSSIAQRASLEKQLNKKGVRIITDIHSSGHGYGGDIQELISVLKPKLLIPSHGEEFMQNALISKAREINIPKENIHCLSIGKSFDILAHLKKN